MFSDCQISLQTYYSIPNSFCNIPFQLYSFTPSPLCYPLHTLNTRGRISRVRLSLLERKKIRLLPTCSGEPLVGGYRERERGRIGGVLLILIRPLGETDGIAVLFVPVAWAERTDRAVALN